MSSLYNSSTLSRIVIPAGSSRSAIYEPDENGFDVGGILAAANNEVPLIDPKQLKYDKSLGSGTTFDVHRELFRPAHPHASPYFVAVKYMRLAGKTRQTRQAMSRSLMREIKVLTRPALNSHGCIVPLLGYGWRNDPRDGAIPYLITDYSEFGTLKDYLRMIKTSLRERRELALDVAVGLDTLHKSKIIHGDVKMSNVLVYGIGGRFVSSRPQSAKLADFGSTLFEEDFAGHSGTCRYHGTPVYNPPEFRRVGGSGDSANFVDCTRADVYSFGLLTWEVIAGGKSYYTDVPAIQAHEGIPASPKSDRLLQQILDTPEVSAASLTQEVVRSTLERCLRDDPEERKTMSEVTEILSQGAE
jgi:serine/threonine protein kinase